MTTSAVLRHLLRQRLTRAPRLQRSATSRLCRNEQQGVGRGRSLLLARTKFSYGPGAWEHQYPIINTGQRQSPIDINPEVAVYNEELAQKPLVIKYQPEAYLPLCNTGLTLKAAIKSISEVSGGPLTSVFRLDNFHFHWGSKDSKGSEHKIYGKVFPGEVHFVHWNTHKYKSMEEAMDKPDGLAVLAVFLSLGSEENPVLAKLTEVMDDILFKDTWGHVSGCEPFQLLPQNTKDYWTYTGSLTTPPFYESVTWIVFKHVTEISHEQIEALRKLCCDDADDHIVDNCRPPMPLGHRALEASFVFNGANER